VGCSRAWGGHTAGVDICSGVAEDMSHLYRAWLLWRAFSFPAVCPVWRKWVGMKQHVTPEQFRSFPEAQQRALAAWMAGPAGASWS